MSEATSTQRWITTSAAAARVIGIVVAAVGMTGLVGWWADIDYLRNIASGLASMKPNTALGFVLCGTALAVGLQRDKTRWVRVVCGSLAAMIGLATLAEYAFVTDDLIDSWLIGGPSAADTRMTPASATGLACGGLGAVVTGLSTARTNARKVVETTLSLAVMLVGTLGLLGYLYGVKSLYATAIYSTMAVHTASVHALIGIGLTISRPDQGLAKLIGSPNAGGVMARRLIGFFLLMAPLLGWLRQKGQEAGWYDTTFGLALLVTAMMILGVTMVWFTARELDRADAWRSALQEDLAASVSREHATAAQRGSILNALPGGIALLDIEGRIVVLNKRWKSVMPETTSPERQSGVPFVEWLGGLLGTEEGELRGVAEGITGVIKGGQRRHLSELRVKQKNAEGGSAAGAAGGAGAGGAGGVAETVRWLEVRIAPVLSLTGTRAPGAQGEPTGAVVMVSDVTDRHRMEEQLVNAQRLEAVGRLAGGVAHDFNNLLTAVTGHRALAQAAIDAGRSAKESLDAIEQAAHSGAELTQQLLAFGRMQILAPKVIAVSELVGNVRLLIEQNLGEQIKLKVVAQEGVWPTKIDSGRIEQVLINLVLNARDAITKSGRGGAVGAGAGGAGAGGAGAGGGGTGGAGGTVVIETTNAVLDDSYAESRIGVAPGPYVCLSVSDTGTGMSPEIMARLFEPFFTTKERGTGSGLGLATSFGIVKQHGGHIAAYSEPGRGSTFRVYLPAAQGEAVEPRHAPGPKATGGSERVLLVDDHIGARAAVAGMLRQLGYTVTEAEDGATARQRLREATPGAFDVLICDVMLPDGTGPEIAANLRAEAGWSHLPVLFISGYTANAIVHHGVLDSGVQFLAKPFTMDELGLKVREVLTAPGA